MRKIKNDIINKYDYIKQIKSKPIFHQFSWYFLSIIISQGLSFISTIFIYRYLGPVNIGLMSFVGNFLVIFFISAAIDNFVYWNLLKYDDRGQIELLVKVFYHKLRILSCLLIIGLIFAYIYLPISLFYLVLIATLCSYISSLFQSSIYLSLHKKVKLITITSTALYITLFICKMLAVYFELSLAYFILFNFIDLSFIILFYYMTSRNIIHLEDFKKYIPSLRETFIFLFNIKNVILYICTSYLLWRVDQIILSSMGNAYRLGIYAGAVKIVELSNLFLGILTATITPYIASNYRNYNNNFYMDEASNRGQKKLLFIFILSAIAMTLFIVIFTPFIIKLLFGDRFIESVPILFWYAWTIIPASIMSYYVNIYFVKGKYIEMSVIFMISIIINTGLIYILFPLYGVKGVCVATIVGYSVSAIMMWRRDKERPQWNRKKMIPVKYREYLLKKIENGFN